MLQLQHTVDSQYCGAVAVVAAAVSDEIAVEIGIVAVRTYDHRER